MTITDVPLPASYRPLEPTGETENRGAARLLDPGSGLSLLVRLRDGLPDLPALGDASSQLTDPELTDAARLVAAYLQRAEAVLVSLTADAIDRGAVQNSTAGGAAQWVARVSAGEGADTLISAEARNDAGPLVTNARIARAESSEPVVPEGLRVPGIEPAHATRIANIAQASLHASHRVMTNAVREGRASVTVARSALHHVNRIKHVLPDATYDEIHGWFLTLPAAAGKEAVAELTRQIIAEYGTPDALDDIEAKQERLEFLRSWDDKDGMTGFEGLLSADHAAEFKHILQSLSGPAPRTSCCEDPHHRHTSGSNSEDPGAGDPATVSARESADPARLVRLADDDRSPGKRRIDALMMIFRRVARWLDADPTVTSSGPVHLSVTVDFETLAGKLRPGGGSGAGITRDGLSITPATVRRMACDANILPMVLGSPSEPLDVGRSKRLFTGGLRQAVIHRDKHCTFDGCGRPPDWCDVHHAIPWAEGGPTRLDLGRLLCDEHHHIVHRDDLVPIVTATGNHWVPRKRG
ncbi:HNH endonuclease signature motif containing protein [Calidifontibacter terrae]